MRSFINFLKRQSYIFVFVLLQTLSFYLIVSSEGYQRSSFHSFVSEINGGFFSIMKEIREFFLLRNTNEELAQENAFLKEHCRQFLYPFLKALKPPAIFPVPPLHYYLTS